MARSSSPTDHAGDKHKHARGWTLVELMVVLVLMSLATALASLALRPPAAARLEEDAHRLAALLDSARAQSLGTGVPVRWQLTDGGFEFKGLPGPRLPGRFRHASTLAQVQGGSELLLGPEPVIPAQAVLLFERERPGERWQVATDGVRPFHARALSAGQAQP